ncbi:PAS domain-containing sensor histidine kinase [Pseudocnuella soli]|uniref:PAS domain-containing sensor histidine kinase n=1 Tax=Pseudocnuella soli TaxID=2502779 RepID=UPI001046E376|nr:PAS domain S-box protein [Pseudocnuella soli]
MHTAPYYPTIQQFQRLFDYSLDVLCYFDAAGRFVQASKASVQLWGYAPQELVGKPFTDLVVPEDLERSLHTFAEGKKGGKVVGFENNFRRKDGSIVPVIWVGEWDEQEQMVIAIARDATEKRAAEAYRSKQDQLLESILERIHEGFVAMDRNFRVTFWNNEAENILQVPKDAVMYKVIWDCFPPEIATVFRPRYEQALTTQQPVHFETFRPQVNMAFDIFIYPSPDGLVVFIRDITQRKQTEEELRRLSLVAQQTDNIIAISDLDHRVIWVNEAFTRITGYHPDEAIGKPIGSIFDGPGTGPHTFSIAQEKMAQCEPFRMEVPAYKKSGDTYWAEILCQPVFDEAGKLVHFFSMATDITERKKLQQVLDREQQQRQQMITTAAIKVQEQERSQVSRELHDNVNQVLTTVKLYQELCRDGIGDTGELVNKSIGLLQDAINEIRSLSKRLSAPSLNRLNLRESVTELIETIGITDKLEIELDTNGIEALEVAQDVHLTIYRILQEHFTNILKHAEATKVWVRLYRVDSVLVCQVRDNGKGFDPGQKRKGIGIGNMATRAESVKGQLLINSGPGQGCELEASIPIYEE